MEVVLLPHRWRGAFFVALRRFGLPCVGPSSGLDTDSALAFLHDLSKPLNLRRWQESGQPWQWIESRSGAWGHDHWLGLLETLQHSEFWPLAPDAVGAILEKRRIEWQNLQRWKQSGSPQRWVESRQAVWAEADCRALIDALRHSKFWPLDLAGPVGRRGSSDSDIENAPLE